MPLIPLSFRAGINREGTDYSNEGGWYDANLVRFRKGYPEKIGAGAKIFLQRLKAVVGHCTHGLIYKELNGSRSVLISNITLLKETLTVM